MSIKDTWDVLPKWVKIATICVGIPAWLVLGYDSLSADGFSDPVYSQVAQAAFFGVVLLNMVFVARGFWRMDL